MPVVLGVAFGVSLLVPAAPAAAHNSLTGSDPRDGARVAKAPARIELRFLAKPAPATTKITITGPDNVVAGGPPAFDGSRVRVPFKPAAAGLYIVAYRLASSDGHPVKGEVRFTLTTGTSADPSAAPSATGGTAPSAGGSAPAAAGGPTVSGASSAAPAATATAGATPAGSPVPAAQESSQLRGWLWTIAAALLVGALVVGLQRRHRARRR
ncbi:copper resistance CopC family protein [Micromonospora parathelypteridis]|uniref:copper resistance CopC family protein n=1 Tax=Micromonospora parathelypteridis TaxID=1839617 RepID=UPI001E46B49D|nr:copper resistance CopC family protein [Micromonospora parathelypteridis]